MVLSPLRHPDRLMWKGTKNGMFSVKSAYHLEMTRRNQDTRESSSSEEDSDLWRKIWDMKAPTIYSQAF
jgi:hypothetical protein